MAVAFWKGGSWVGGVGGVGGFFFFGVCASCKWG